MHDKYEMHGAFRETTLHLPFRRALIAALEEYLSRLGIPQLFVQPRQDVLGLFTKRLDFEPLHPASAEVLWRRVPIAFTDSVVLGKDLTGTGDKKT
jgi:hypothetical protein